MRLAVCKLSSLFAFITKFLHLMPHLVSNQGAWMVHSKWISVVNS